MRSPPTSTPTEKWAFEELEKLERALASALSALENAEKRITALEEKVAQSAT